MRSAEVARFWSAFVPGVCRSARAQLRVLDMGDAPCSLGLWVPGEDCPYRFLMFAACATAASGARERPQIGGT